MTALTDPRPLGRELALLLLHDMLRIRRLEEAAAEWYGAGKIRGFLHLYIGEEAVAVGAMHALLDDDAVVATYREHGHALLRGISMNAIMAEMFGKREGCSHGRGGSMHLFDARHRFFGGNAIVAGGLPLAVGLALADKLRGIRRITACFFGEGAMAEGAFHEAMNLAALWQLPVLFCCENNLYAMGTALERSQSRTDLCAKAAVFGMPVHSFDGMDVTAVYQGVLAATAQMRSDGGPCFVECQTYRFRAHSMFDPELYRDKAEVEWWKQRGPIHNFSAKLKEINWLTEAEFLQHDAEVMAEVAAAVHYADAGTLEPVADLYRHVYAGPHRTEPHQAEPHQAEPGLVGDSPEATE